MTATAPAFDNPYPQQAWREITRFSYDGPLTLYRAKDAVKTRRGKDALYVVFRPYTVRFALDGKEQPPITVPKGMLTDLSSVPAAFRSVVGRVGPHLEASIVHDFLYIAWQDLPGYRPRDEDRRFADVLMRQAMQEAKVGSVIRALVYRAVRLGGGSAFFGRDEPRYVDLPD